MSDDRDVLRTGRSSTQYVRRFEVGAERAGTRNGDALQLVDLARDKAGVGDSTAHCLGFGRRAGVLEVGGLGDRVDVRAQDAVSEPQFAFKLGDVRLRSPSL